jgi:hypothetical protein
VTLITYLQKIDKRSTELGAEERLPCGKSDGGKGRSLQQTQNAFTDPISQVELIAHPVHLSLGISRKLSTKFQIQ